MFHTHSIFFSLEYICYYCF